ncbi:transcriptional regulator [Alcaligenaceae bacterium]|nr:transcriptional regulator [Alcaligenaceae bacterium]
MASDNNNPFILPGLGQTGDMAQNPILASMEMMRQAWQGLAGAGGIGGSPMAMPTSTEELDRRIKDLRAVENWLRMNLSMLTSTIQGLEVQSATLSTLQSFMSTATGAAHAPTASTDGPSPLEVALGIRRPGQNPASNQEAPAVTPPTASQPAAAESATQNTETNSADAPQPGTDSAYAAQAASAAQGWWDMLQTQFDTLAAATAATLEGAQTASQEAQAQAMASPSKATKAPATKRSQSTRKTAKKAATKSAGKTTPKPVAKKATKAAATSTSKTSAKAGSAVASAPKRSTAKKAGTVRARSSKT